MTGRGCRRGCARWPRWFPYVSTAAAATKQREVTPRLRGRSCSKKSCESDEPTRAMRASEAHAPRHTRRAAPRPMPAMSTQRSAPQPRPALTGSSEKYSLDLSASCRRQLAATKSRFRRTLAHATRATHAACQIAHVARPVKRTPQPRAPTSPASGRDSPAV